MDIVGLIGAAAGVIGIPVAVYLALPTIRAPIVKCEPSQASLYRCLTEPCFQEGWGIIVTAGKLRVSNRPVTIVDAELSYRMPKKYTAGKTLPPMSEGFPPIHIFPRVANDERGSMGACERQGFSQIGLNPGGGEQPFTIQFVLGGNFATEFSRLFFNNELSSMHRGLFFPLRLRFQFEHNGHFHWTKQFDLLCHSWSNKGWTREGSCYIDDSGVTYREGPTSDSLNASQPETGNAGECAQDG